MTGRHRPPPLYGQYTTAAVQKQANGRAKTAKATGYAAPLRVWLCGGVVLLLFLLPAAYLLTPV